jgi:hypothetical protein
MPARGPILVTGGHRSGTGWVSEMLAATPWPPVAYLWEPFNLRARPGMRAAPLRHWFTYVTPPDEPALRAALADTLSFRYHPLAELGSLRSPKDTARMARDWARMLAWRRRDAVPLMKDPIALFSAEWLADTFGMDVIVLIRHPAAFVNSLVRKGWHHPFTHFTEQPALMAELEGYANELERYASTEQPLFDQAILLWTVIHDRIRSYEARRPWTFVRHEDLSLDPIGGFGSLYERLGLRWTPEVEATIRDHSGTGNPVVTADPASHRRDSAASIRAWRKHLADEQVHEIRRRTEAVASTWYSDDDW